MRRQLSAIACVICAVCSVYTPTVNGAGVVTETTPSLPLDVPSFVWGCLAGVSIAVANVLLYRYFILGKRRRDNFTGGGTGSRGTWVLGSWPDEGNVRRIMIQALKTWWREEGKGVHGHINVQGSVPEDIKRSCEALREVVRSLESMRDSLRERLGRNGGSGQLEPLVPSCATEGGQEKPGRYPLPGGSALSQQSGRAEEPRPRDDIGGVNADREVQRAVDLKKADDERLAECGQLLDRAHKRFEEEARRLREKEILEQRERLAEEGEWGEIRHYAESLMRVLWDRAFEEVSAAKDKLEEVGDLHDTVEAQILAMRQLSRLTPELKQIPSEPQPKLECPSPEELARRARLKAPGNIMGRFRDAVEAHLNDCIKTSLEDYRRRLSGSLSRAECEPPDGDFVELIAIPACAVIEHIEQIAEGPSSPPAVTTFARKKKRLISEIAQAARLVEEHPAERDEFDHEKHQHPPEMENAGRDMKAKVLRVLLPGYRERKSGTRIRKAKVVVGA